MVCIYHNFFIHLSVDGHLGCFHVLAIVNSAAMNNGIQVSFFNFCLKGLHINLERWDGEADGRELQK